MQADTAIRHKYFKIDNISAFKNFTDELHTLIYNALRKGYRTIIFLCIGTDRSTGDSLGPLIGYKIKDLKYGNVFVHGNLDNPVHAQNIAEVMKRITEIYEIPFIVAIDACLGKHDHVGCISMGEGSIKPGSAVNKDLAPVGNIFINGIVNFGGFMDLLVLQNTRLNLVMQMADFISAGIRYVLWKIKKEIAV